jgi:hypothetical protein
MKLTIKINKGIANINGKELPKINRNGKKTTFTLSAVTSNKVIAKIYAKPNFTGELTLKKIGESKSGNADIYGGLKNAKVIVSNIYIAKTGKKMKVS